MTMDLSILRRWLGVFGLALALGFAPIPAGLVWADEAKAQADQTAAERPLPEDAVTKHTLTIDGAPLVYTATVGYLPLADANGTVKAQVGYVSYARDGETRDRPITFVFNGGPGASSAYLNLGALGPRRVRINDDGTVPPPPVLLVDNPMTWLVFTDLVFVDPVGTGFSRPTRVDGKPVPNSEFWSVNPDIDWNARFIRQYLTHADRWTSPKFLVGESYGGFRVARLAEALAERFGVGLNGAILVSPVLEFGLALGEDRFLLWPTVLRLPSYAATAWHHGRVEAASGEPAARDRFLDEVERFSLAEYLPRLATLPDSPPEQRQALYARLAAYTGLPVATIERADGRIGLETFVKEALAEGGRVIGRYDSSVSIPDPDPGAPRFEDSDPTLTSLTAPFTTAMYAYLQGELGYATEQPYILLNRAVSRDWDWGGRRNGTPGAADNLRAAMVANRHLDVLIVHGRFDLITPYFSTAYVTRQMRLDPSLRDNLSLALYDGGHMMYLHKAGRERLFQDVRQFFAASTRGAS